VTLIGLAGATPVRIPGLRTTLSATDPFVFTAMAAFGPMPACVTALAGVLGAALGRNRNRDRVHLAFNLGNLVLATAASSVVYLAVGGEPGGPVTSQFAPLVAAGTCYFVINTWLVSAVVGIETGRPILEIWRESFLWTAASIYAGFPLAAALLYMIEIFGPSGLALGVPPCWLMAAFYKAHKDRQEAQQQRIDQIQGLNQQLEDKVAERTSELRDALSHLEQANTRLLLANEELTQANRLKNEFLANISHELRTPLNAVIGFSDLLRDPSFGGLNPQQHEFARDIHESGEHLLRLINEILDLAKIEAGRMELHREQTDVGRVIGEACAMVRPQAAKKQLSLHIRLADGLRLALIDPGMCRQVLVNLLSNAVKFTPEAGTVRVTARNEGRDLVIVVDDTGIGIQAEHVPHIFDEFYQVDGTYARSYGGTGLGLALVRSMVEMHAGSIEVESVVDRGTSFKLRFPDCLSDELPRDEVPARRPKLAPVDRETASTILVVEDNPINRKLARNVLSSRGYRVIEAASGEEALRSVAAEPPDLVLLDVQLPGMDGIEVVRRLRSDPDTAELIVVALTAHAARTDEERALSAGCAGYITKPIRLADFPAQVESFLRSPALQ